MEIDEKAIAALSGVASYKASFLFQGDIVVHLTTPQLLNDWGLLWNCFYDDSYLNGAVAYQDLSFEEVSQRLVYGVVHRILHKLVITGRYELQASYAWKAAPPEPEKVCWVFGRQRVSRKTLLNDLLLCGAMDAWRYGITSKQMLVCALGGEQGLEELLADIEYERDKAMKEE
jgi:hypothetical protein